MPSQQFLSAVPVFHARDFTATVEYYTNVLGFTVAWTNGDYSCVAREEIEIHIFGQTNEADRVRMELNGNTVDDLFILVADVDSLYAEMKAKGAELLDEPTDHPYGMREFHVCDPNGYILAFSQSIVQSATR